jgi:hypothetical protein
MKARSFVVGGLLAGAMLMATSVGASANFAWCMSDPPIQVVTPGGHNLTVNNMVYLPPYALHLKNSVTDSATVQPDGRGGTLITVHVVVPAPSHVVSSEARYQVRSEKDGSNVITLYLDVPIT